MFTIFGGKQQFCDGLSRRNFLQIGAFGAGLTLADMLRTQALGNAGSTRPRSAISGSSGQRNPRARA